MSSAVEEVAPRTLRRRPRRWVPDGGVALARLLACAMCAVCMSATAAELKVLCPDALKGVVVEIARDFVKGRGHRLVFELGAPHVLQKRVAVGNAGDVLIATAAGVGALVRLGRAVEGTEVRIGQAGIGVALRAGGARPDVSTPEGLRRTLLEARVVLVPEAGAGFSAVAHVRRTLARLGIAAEVSVEVPASIREALERVASGEAKLALAASTDIAVAAGVEAAGPLPVELQQSIAFAAAVLRQSNSEAAAREFVAHLAGAPARARLRNAGVYDPPELPAHRGE